MSQKQLAPRPPPLMADLTPLFIPDDALDRVIGALNIFNGDREQLRSDIFSARGTYTHKVWERANAVPPGHMYRKTRKALKALERARDHLVAAHSQTDDEGVSHSKSEPFFEEIERAINEQIQIIEIAIAAGGPRRGAPRKDEFTDLVKDLEEIYTRITGKKPTSTRNSPEHSSTKSRPEFHRFVIACLHNIDRYKASLQSIDASIFEALRSR